MSSYLGDVHLGDTIDFKFTTVDNTTGVATTLAGTPVISAYADNTATAITAGIFLGVDYGSPARTGLNNIRVQATAANGYAAGNYALVVTAGTVGGTSMVGYVVGRFSIDKRQIVDGLSFVDAMEASLAVLFGTTAPSGSTVAFKKRDGTTTKVTVTYGTTDGQRTGSTIS